MAKNGQVRIKIFGCGGQGIQFMADVLIRYLSLLDYSATFFPEYDAAVRGGQINAEIAYSRQKTPCPQGLNFKAVFYLTPNDQKIKAEKTFELTELIDKKNTYKNMYVLGKIIHILGLPMNKTLLNKALPDKKKKTNYQLIKEGYQEFES